MECGKPERYGRLTVVEKGIYLHNGRQKREHWKCVCDCGTEKLFQKNNLIRSTRSCGCSHHKITRADPPIGARYGQLTLIDPTVQVRKQNQTFKYYLCRCECGIEKLVRKYGLLNGTVISCGCYNRQVGKNKRITGLQNAIRNEEASYRRHAQAKGRSYELTREQFTALILRPCYYCGREKTRRLGAGPNPDRHEPVYGTGIDRVDSSKGYSVDNVVPCCTDCNKAKMNRNADDFLEWIQITAAYQQSLHYQG